MHEGTATEHTLIAKGKALNTTGTEEEKPRQRLAKGTGLRDGVEEENVFGGLVTELRKQNWKRK